MSNSDKSKAETEIGIKKEEGVGVVRGSLGTLLSSYGTLSDSDTSSEDESDNDIPIVVKEEGVVLGSNSNVSKSGIFVTNPVFKERNKQALSNPEVVDSVQVIIKKEPSEADEEIGNGANKIDEGAMDFSVLNKECKAEFDLEIDDFLTGASTYCEARPVKLEVESGTSDSESDSEHSEENEDDDNDGNNDEKEKSENAKRKQEGIKVKGEMSLDDLPPIEDLHISVPHDECKPIGLIKSVVDPLVIVEAYLDTPALDLDSVLFLDEGDRALGHIFDVIGPVKQPMYCVRFNSKEHIEKNKVEVGMTVFCAPKTPYTTYVFLAQLRRLKGSDASWLNDIEPPVEEVEYSDDEMERIAKKKKRNRKFQNACATEEDAMPKEGEDVQRTGTGFRGRKRQYNHNGNHQNFSNNQMPAAVSHPHGCPPPPFMPPMVPGFSPFPYAPPHGYAGPPNQGPWFPGPNRMTRPRGFPGPRGPRGFRPPNYGSPQESYANSFQANAPRPNADASNWQSWNPPPQWQGANMSNFNFGGTSHNQNPYAHMNQMPRYANPSPQPPPPPPPPGL